MGVPSPLRAGPELDPLRNLAIQDGGRIKPLDTFARETARRIGARAFGSESIRGLDPVEWVLGMLVDPDRWKQEKIIRVTHAGLREAAGLSGTETYYSFNELVAHEGFNKAAERVHEKFRQDREAKLDPIEREISGLYETLNVLAGVFSGDGLRIVPHPTDSRATWFSLKDLDGIDAAPILRIKTLLGALLAAYQAHDLPNVQSSSAALEKRLRELAPAVYPARRALELEVHYNRLKPFRLAWLFYLVSLLSLFGGLSLAPSLGRVGIAIMLLGFVVHAYGMVLRCMISGHPPVTNMYESVIWVAWGAVLFSLIFEAIYKARYFALCSGIWAVLSLILADNVPILDGSIEPLVPVLRDNMWLTIHVLTITLAYAAFFLAMVIAHLNLGLFFFAPARKELLSSLSLFLYRCLQVGTLLGVIGTMLGGWWASYSWGRFWGWDAKETSIFVALMFYLAILHGRMVGLLRDFGTAIGAVLGALGALWAWYGVNFVLGVGLHSYGFGSGGYFWVGGFVAFEVFVVVASLIRYRSLSRAGESAAAHPAPVVSKGTDFSLEVKR